MTPFIYFLRHGQTAWNVEQRLQGQADTDMNAIGRKQVDRNGVSLGQLIADPEHFDFVASPMRRTRETMERVRRGMGLDQMAYRTDARLVEINFGDWQGRTFLELEQRYTGVSRARRHDKWDFVPPGDEAESYAMLTERVRSWLDEVVQPTVCVTHGGVLRAIFHLVAHMPKNEAATLEIPQDRVLKVKNGCLDWL